MENTVIKSDVVIVGSGAVGSSAAFFLKKAGLDVVVLEKNTVGSGCSVANGGENKMDFRGVPELSVGMYGVTEIWPILEKEIGVEYKTTGGYRNAMNQKEMDILQTFMPYADKYNMHIEYLNHEQLHKRAPMFSDKIYGAAYCKEDGRANPLKTTLGLYAKCRDMGVRYYDHEKVIGIDLEKGVARRVFTEKGHVYEADHIIITACHGSREILNTVGIDIPFTHALCEVFVTEPVPIFMEEIVTAVNAGYYGHQTAHGSLVYGAGSKIGPFQREGYHVENRLTTQYISSGAYGLSHLFPSLKKTKIIRSWSGWHDRTPDDNCCVGQVEEIPGLYIGCGFSGHGFGIAPPVGKILSELVLGQTLGADISGLKFDRFLPINAFTGEAQVKEA